MGELRLLKHDRELVAAIEDPGRRAAAEAALVANQLTLGGGQRLHVRSIVREASLGVLVLSGFLAREITIAGRASADLAGPEDLLCPEHMEPADGLFPYTVSWTALAPTRLALLDGAFRERLGEWPEIACGLIERARRPGDRAAFGRAVARGSTVDARLLMSLWHLASLWSSVGRDGVQLAVPLSHERLARLIGASRPTVTAALGRLRKEGYLDQKRDGIWLLRGPAQDGAELPDLGSTVVAPEWINARARRGAAPARSANERTTAHADTHSRLLEMRELLRVASDRHAKQLMRLRDSSEELRATTARNTLANLVRSLPDGSADGQERAE